MRDRHTHIEDVEKLFRGGILQLLGSVGFPVVLVCQELERESH